MIFMGFEIRKRVLPRPAVIAGDFRPSVIIPRLAAHIDHAVDRGAAAQDPAARIALHTIVKARIGLCVIHPICARIANAIQIAHGDVNPWVAVGFARFEQ